MGVEKTKVIARLIEALATAQGPLEELLACPEGDVRERARLVLATTAAIDVLESACGFIRAVADESCAPSAKCVAAYPECRSTSAAVQIGGKE